MITEEKIIELLEKYERLSKKELKKLMLKGDKDYVPVEETLKKLKRDRVLLKDKLGRYYLAGKSAESMFGGKKLGSTSEIAAEGKKTGKHERKVSSKGKRKARSREIEGKIALIKNKYAFFEGEGGERLYIPAEKLMGAMLNDRVTAVKTGGKESDRGAITSVLERANQTVVGTIENKNGDIFLVPDDYRLNVKIKLDKKEGLPENFKAVADI